MQETYNEKDNCSLVVKHFKNFRVHCPLSGAPCINCDHAFLHEGTYGVIGLAITFEDNGAAMMKFITGDDGFWRVGANEFDTFWIIGAQVLLKHVEDWLRENCDRVEDKGKVWGWKKRVVTSKEESC